MLVNQLVRLNGQLHLVVAVLFGQTVMFLNGFDAFASHRFADGVAIVDQHLHQFVGFLVDALHERLRS